MSVRNPEDLDNDNHDVIQSDDGYEVAYDDIDSPDQISDEWIDDDQVDAEIQEPVKKKKSKSTFWIILGAVLLAIIGFVAFSGGGDNQDDVQQSAEGTAVSPETTAETVLQPIDKPQLEEPVAVDNQIKQVESIKPEPDQTGIMNDQNVVAKVENMAEAPSTPLISNGGDMLEKQTEIPTFETSGVSGSQGSQTSVEGQGNSLVNIVTPNIKSVSDFPTVETIKKAETAQTEPVSPAVENKEINDSADVLVQKEPKVAEIQDKLNTAEVRIADLEKTISEKDAELNEQKSGASVATRDSEEIELLKAKISELERKLSNSLQTSEAGVYGENKLDKPLQKKTVRNSVSKKATAASKNSLIRAKPLWILKSANPTRAMIYNKATGETRTVSVGDTVDGLGRILSITERNSLWVVNASRANISE